MSKCRHQDMKLIKNFFFWNNLSIYIYIIFSKFAQSLQHRYHGIFFVIRTDYDLSGSVESCFVEAEAFFKISFKFNFIEKSHCLSSLSDCRAALLIAVAESSTEMTLNVDIPGIREVFDCNSEVWVISHLIIQFSSHVNKEGLFHARTCSLQKLLEYKIRKQRTYSQNL